MTSAATVLSPVSSIPAHVESDTVSDLTRWIPEQIRKRASRFVLAQRVGDSAHHTVDEWTTAELTDAGALAETIYATAVRDAQALKASQAYGVFALRDDRPEPISRMYFRIDAGAIGWMQPADTPDERGVTSMLMRHTEASARLALGHSRGILDQYERLQEQTVAHHGRLLEQAYARIAILEAREIEALQLRDQLQSTAREKEMALAQLTRRTELQKLAIDKLSQFAPLILAKLGRGEGPTPSANVVGAIDVLTQFIVSITPEQFQEIAPLLRPEQMALLAHLYDVAETHKQQQAQQPPRESPASPAASAPQPSPSPEAPPTTPPEKS